MKQRSIEGNKKECAGETTYLGLDWIGLDRRWAGGGGSDHGRSRAEPWGLGLAQCHGQEAAALVQTAAAGAALPAATVGLDGRG